MSSTSATPVSDPAPLAEPARILNVFIAPTKTFTDLRRSAAWWGPFVLVTIISLVYIYTLDRQIGFLQLSKNIVEHSTRAEQFGRLPADQQAKQLEVSAKITREISYATPILILVINAIIAAVLMGTFNFGTGARVKYKTAFAILMYGGLPGVISLLLAMVSVFAGADPEGFDMRNPIASNPAYAMDAAGNQFAYAMASALDVFIIWNIVLIGIGFACNSKVKRSTAIIIVAAWYLIYKLAGAGLGALFS